MAKEVKGQDEMQLYYAGKCISNYTKALYFGSEMLDQNWKNNITSNCETLWKMVVSPIMAFQSSDDKIALFEKLDNVCHQTISNLKYEMNAELAQAYFNIAIGFSDKKQHAKTRQSLQISKMRASMAYESNIIDPKSGRIWGLEIDVE